MREPPATDRDATSAEQRPPLGSWGRLYGLVLGVLAIDLLLLWLLTEHYR